MKAGGSVYADVSERPEKVQSGPGTAGAVRCRRLLRLRVLSGTKQAQTGRQAGKGGTGRHRSVGIGDRDDFTG